MTNILATALLLAATATTPKETPTKPTPLSTDEKLGVAQEMLVLTDLRNALVDAQNRFREAAERWNKSFADMKAKHEADNCELDMRQEWQCKPAQEATK